VIIFTLPNNLCTVWGLRYNFWTALVLFLVTIWKSLGSWKFDSTFSKKSSITWDVHIMNIWFCYVFESFIIITFITFTLKTNKARLFTSHGDFCISNRKTTVVGLFVFNFVSPIFIDTNISSKNIGLSHGLGVKDKTTHHLWLFTHLDECFCLEPCSVYIQLYSCF